MTKKQYDAIFAKGFLTTFAIFLPLIALAIYLGHIKPA